MKRESLLDTGAVADWLQLTPATIARRAAAGSLPAVRIGRRFRFRREDVQRWLDARRTDARKDGKGRGGRP